MTIYVLVSGAWHAGWCWERVVPKLEAIGHRAIAPDLIGMGSDRTALSTVTLAKWADQIAHLVREQGDKVVFVGHSRGCIIISEVAERVPQSITSLVYLAAFLVESGETLMATSARLPRERALNTFIAQPDGTTSMRSEAVQPIFYNTTEAEWIDRAKSLVSAEPTGSLRAPCTSPTSAMAP